MKKVYRKLQPNESKTYRALRLESLEKYPDSFGSRYEEQRQRKQLAFEGFIEKATPENFIVGAFQGDELIGICGFYRLRDERCRHRGEIIQMYVQPQYQGQQIGFNLLKATVEAAFSLSGLEQIELQVMSNLAPANTIYERAGFQKCGVQKRFYKRNEVYFDQRIMILYRENHPISSFV